MNIMAGENDAVMAEVMNLLEAEPASLPAEGSDIATVREKLAVLVCSGRCKEAIGVNLTQEQVKRLEDKEVMKYTKRHQTYVGGNISKEMIENSLAVSTKALSHVLRIKDAEGLKNEIKNSFMITQELSDIIGYLALRFGRLLAFANAFLITAKHVDFSAEESRHPSRDSEGYPLSGVDEVPTAEQSSANAE